MAITGLRTHNVADGTYLAAVRVVEKDEHGNVIVKSDDRGSRWQLTSDRAAISAAHDADVIFAKDAFELASQLEKRNPAPAGFTFVASNSKDLATATTVDCDEHLRPTTANQREIYAVARKYGCVTYKPHELKGRPSNRSYRYEILDDEFYYDTDADLLCYDPKKVARMTASRTAAETKHTFYRAMSVDSMCQVCWHIIVDYLGKRFPALIRNNHNWEHGLWYYDSPTRNWGRNGVVRELVKCITVTRQLHAIKGLRKDTKYRKWLTEIGSCMGMLQKQGMDNLLVIVEEECRRAKIKTRLTPVVSKRLSKNKSKTT